MKPGTTQFEREARTIRAMVQLYCADHHAPAPSPCLECAAIVTYALGKLEKCPWGEKKPVCARCTIHCYEQSMRLRVGRIMRYAGPRMVKRHPVLAAFHLIRKMGFTGFARKKTA
jgi:hypothetical protein